MISHLDLLNHYTEQQQMAAENPVANPPRPTLPTSLVEQHLIDPTDDPHGGNENNRKVAERVAKERARREGNTAPVEPVAAPPAPVEPPAVVAPASPGVEPGNEPPAPTLTAPPLAPPVWKPNS